MVAFEYVKDAQHHIIVMAEELKATCTSLLQESSTNVSLTVTYPQYKILTGDLFTIFHQVSPLAFISWSPEEPGEVQVPGP